MLGCKANSTGSRNGPASGYYEHGNKHSGSIKGGKILGQLSDY